MKCLFEMMLYKCICFTGQFTQFFKMRIAALNPINHLNIMGDAFEYFRTNLVDITGSYEGEYVAIIDDSDSIVAHGRDAKKVYSAAKEKFPRKTIFLGQVPRKEAMIL